MFVVATAAAAWLSGFANGLFPALTRMLMDAVARNARIEEKAIVQQVAAPLFFWATTLSATIFFTGEAMWPNQGSDVHNLAAAVMVASGLLIFLLALHIPASVRIAYQQQSLVEGFSALGNSLGLVALIFGVWLGYVDLRSMLALANAGSILGRLINLIDMMRVRMWPRYVCWRMNGSTAWRLFMSSWLVSAAVLLSYLQTSFILVQAKLMFADEAVAGLGVLMTLYNLLVGGITPFGQALWPSIMDAVVRQDYAWLSTASVRYAGAVGMYSLASGIAVAVFGSAVLRIWVGSDFDLPLTFFFASGCFVATALWQHAWFIVLLGSERWRRMVSGLLLQAIMCQILLVLTKGGLGPVSVPFSMAVPIIACNGWLYPSLFRMYIGRTK